MLMARSPVRISFGGGGTDLPAYYERFGGAVLSTAIDKYFYTILRKRDDGNIQVISSDLRKLENWRDIGKLEVKGSDLEIPLAAIKELGCELSVDLFLASEIPPGTGLGSSASVCVNVLKILSEYLTIGLSRHEIAERAYHIARDVLGKPVGKQDEYATAFGGLNYIEFRHDGTVSVQPISLPPDVLRELQSNLMLFFTGTAHNSWDILKDQESSTKAVSGMAVEALHEIRELADRMRSVLQRGELDRFGKLLDVGWQAKKRISSKISNSNIDDLYNMARSNGALGGKITGAGGGGFLLLYCPELRQQKVREAFVAYRVPELSFGFDVEGARIVINDPFLDSDANSGLSWQFIPCTNAVS
jgi:D-glycero-alpha-D-manno-heptose-7-phosphate kinase